MSTGVSAGVSQLSKRCGGFRSLATNSSVQWEPISLGDSLPCPSGYNASEYGLYVDCVIRHFLSPPGEFRDHFAESASKTKAGDFAPRVRRAYARARGPLPTARVLAALLTVSKAKWAFISGEWAPSKFRCSLLGASWFARLQRMLAACLPAGDAYTNFGVRYTDESRNSVYGEPDALVGETVIELKACKTMQCISQWKCQALMYAAILRRADAPVKEARIVNIACGVYVRADLASWSEHETLAWACSSQSRKGATCT